MEETHAPAAADTMPEATSEVSPKAGDVESAPLEVAGTFDGDNPHHQEFAELVREVASQHAPVGKDPPPATASRDIQAPPAGLDAPPSMPATSSESGASSAQEIGDVSAAEAAPAPPAGVARAQPAVVVSVALKAAAFCVAVTVAVAQLAAFLNGLGAAARAAGYVDVQFYLQRRRGKKANDEPEIWGLVLDVDVPTDDPFGSFAAAGLPPPTCCWPTRNGYKGAWSFNRPVETATFTPIAQQFTVAVPGSDPGSWLVTQAQHLPVGLKETLDGVVDINLPATQTNGMPLDTNDYLPELPARLERALAGARRLTTAEREAVEDWLDEHGIPAPEEPGRIIYDACPIVEKHDTACCYVYRQADGSIDITCLGGHAGEGRKFWSEVGLHREATGDALNGVAIDAVDDIPMTWAGIEFLRDRFGRALADEAHAAAITAAAILAWQRAKAAKRLRHLLRKAANQGVTVVPVPAIEDLVETYRRKIEGGRTGAVRVLYDGARKELGHLLVVGGIQATRSRSDSLSLKSHLHEWKSTMAFDLDLVVEEDEEGEKTGTIALVADPEFTSVWNKAIGGDASFLAVLGTPIVEMHELPVAYLRDGWTIDPATRCLHFIRTARMKPGNADFDVLGFFRQLFHVGKLPLATEDDIPRFVMAIAIPLLRLVAPGLLGVFWFIGPPGAGKDYLAAVISAIWRHAVAGVVKVAFDLNLTDDLEQKRCFAAAGPAVYARAKEAGKRADMIDLLIRLAGTDEVTARGMRKDEVNLQNIYTYVADSAEDLPERREISRRTVTINVAHIDDSVSKGEVAQEIIDHAPDIIASLKQLVESRPAEFYLNHADTGSRPVVPVALADLLGATLPEVSGASTEELFRHLHYYVTNGENLVPEEDRPVGRDKDGRETLLFQSFRLAHFIDVMKVFPGRQQFFKTHPSTRAIERLLQREIKDFVDVDRRKKPYLRVEVNGTPFAFKLVAGRQNFVFVPELEFRTKMGLGPSEEGADAGASGKAPKETPQAEGATPAESGIAPRDTGPPPVPARKGPKRFSSSELRNKGTTEGASDATKRK